ncbi:MAG TPA: HD domain-containing protein, partial [Candidatus Dormibacteraeota bacterium]|nr:HD domain-containing protein [Candidatus Dormibacteraeota bacterium]
MLADVAHGFGWPRPARFERFGTGHIRGDGFVAEVVRARSERYDPESRKPDVKPGTLEEDVMRRDFTVNALCQTLSGRVIDITGRGVADLRARVLRTPLDPADTFSEDPLRMFRAARFVAQLGFTLADGIIEAMRAQAQRASILSIERISEELRKLLTSPHPSSGMRVLRDGGLLDAVLPEIAAMIGVEQGGYHIYDVYDHTMAALDRAPPELITRTATLLHDVGKPPTHVVAEDGKHTFYDHPIRGADMSRELLTRLRFSNDEIGSVAHLVRLHLRPIAYDPEEWSDSAVRRLIRDAGELRGRMLDIARADTEASAYPTLAEIDHLEQRMADIDRGGEVSRMRPPLSGDDIMAIGRRGPGPWVGRVLRAIEEAVLEGELAPGDAAGARIWLERHPELLAGDEH